jgi:chromosome segregation ATPase
MLALTKVLREKLPAVERTNSEYKLEVKRLTKYLAELEAEYGYTDADLKLMCEKFGSLSAHMEHVLMNEARCNENSLEQLQRRVRTFTCSLLYLQLQHLPSATHNTHNTQHEHQHTLPMPPQSILRALSSPP